MLSTKEHIMPDAPSHKGDLRKKWSKVSELIYYSILHRLDEIEEAAAMSIYSRVVIESVIAHAKYIDTILYIKIKTTFMALKTVDNAKY